MFKFFSVATKFPEEIDRFGCSDNVLVVRDCGDGTLPSFSVSRYRRQGFGKTLSGKYEYWHGQESNGYRVIGWSALPDVNNIADSLLEA